MGRAKVVREAFGRIRANRSGSAVSPAWVRGFAVLTCSLCILLLNGCSTVQKYATNAVADSMAQSGTVYASDDDMHFVGAATPFGLKSIESLLESVPEHRGLLLAAARGFTQYAYAYVQLPAEEQMLSNVSVAHAERERAERMYIRALEYGVRGLAVGRTGFETRLATAPQSAVMETDVGDTPLLYWTAMAWAAAIAIGNDDPFLLADLPIIEALIQRAFELDEDFDNGALHTLLISLEMSRGAISSGATERARARISNAPSNCLGECRRRHTSRWPKPWQSASKTAMSTRGSWRPHWNWISTRNPSGALRISSCNAGRGCYWRAPMNSSWNSED